MITATYVYLHDKTLFAQVNEHILITPSEVEIRSVKWEWKGEEEISDLPIVTRKI